MVLDPNNLKVIMARRSGAASRRRASRSEHQPRFTPALPHNPQAYNRPPPKCQWADLSVILATAGDTHAHQ